MTLLNHAFVALVAAGTCMLYILEWKITADIVFFFALAVLSGVLAQDPVPKVYKEPESGISFNTWNVPGSSGTGGLTFGMALPSTAMKQDATEFMGYLVSSSFQRRKERRER